VERDGTAMVTERLTITFVGDYHGIFRTIPIEYPGPSHTNYTLYLKVVKVTDENGSPLKYELSKTNDFRKIKIYIPNASDSQKQVEISYLVRNGIRHFDNFDEFYWNVTGGDWPVPVEHATAYVNFPESAKDEGLRAQAFTGVFGSTGSEATARVSGARAEFETTNPLPLRGDFTIDIYIPKGILQEPSALTRFEWFLGSNPILALPPFAFVVMFALWYWKGRDPDPGRSVAPMYEPPPNITPAEAGALVGDEVHPRDITSTIVDLAVRGYLRIEEQSEKILFLNHKDYLFRLLKPMAQWQELKPHESTLLAKMFGEQGELCQLSSLKNHFYTAVPMIKSDIMAQLDQGGMYGLDPDSAHGYGLLGAIAVAAPFIALQWLGAVDFSLSGWLLWVCVIAAAVIVYLFFRIMPAKSLKGAQTTVSIQGFQEFMNRVDGDRLRTMPSNTFERFLPYAMALGVEEHWAKAFSGIMQTPPNWYVGTNPGGFNSMVFAHDIRSMADTAGATFVAQPRASSSGSGFGGGGFGGGGGFSGGGFGGGGGGAF
ncbi:MAG TPA: DUF2207 domain-containing protein, partial [Terriglobales bacterium]|nr:DUF2207 domain-containing protein [Terriglobales bacterium]